MRRVTANVGPPRARTTRALGAACRCCWCPNHVADLWWCGPAAAGAALQSASRRCGSRSASRRAAAAASSATTRRLSRWGEGHAQHSSSTGAASCWSVCLCSREHQRSAGPACCCLQHTPTSSCQATLQASAVVVASVVAGRQRRRAWTPTALSRLLLLRAGVPGVRAAAASQGCG